MLVLADPAGQPMIAAQGQAQAAIVAGGKAGPLERFAAEELQKHIKTLSGAKLQIIAAGEAERLPKSHVLLLVGGPESNELVGRAAGRRQVRLQGLKPEGYILRRIALDGREALVVGGNDEAATMYAAYDLLERLGFVFLLTKDILPEKRADVPLPALDERVEPAFARRGVFINIGYPSQTMWSLEDWKRILGQMAKMRLNFLTVWWLPNTPFVTYDYQGETNFLGDVSAKESGYMLWRRHQGSFLVNDMTVGKEHYQHPRIAPPEMQKVETPEEAKQVAQDMLRGVIAYAKTRAIKTWVAIDPVSIPANLARHTPFRTGDAPFQDVLGGVYMCPTDPVIHEINESRLRNLFAAYPEAEGYYLWFPEFFPVCEDAASCEFYRRERPKFLFDQAARWKAYTNYERNLDRVVDSNNGTLELMRQALAARDRIKPDAKLGIGAFGRGFFFPSLDKAVPKNIPFADMISRAIWTATGAPIEDYGGMGERERTLILRSDDDSGMFGMQFNVNLFYKDRTFEGALANGVTGHSMQVNRARGMEHNEKFLAEGGWKPHLKPHEFYQDYVRRIFGEAAAPEMLKAYEVLEENEEFLGWNQRGNFPCCSAPAEISIIETYAEQPNIYDGATFAGWSGFLDRARNESVYLGRSAERLRQALIHLNQAAPLAAPGARGEVAYLRNKTEAYAMHLDTLVQLNLAYLEFDAAFRARAAGQTDEFMKQLDHSLEMFRQAHQMAIATARKFAEIIDDPSDLGVLYKDNVYMIDGTEIVEKFMQNIVDFHHGRFYFHPVPLEKVFNRWPKLQRGRY
jgi:hypothetical protein